MPPQICPFLGLRADADTAFEFASRGNHCYHANPVAAVEPGHQREFCLTERHAACPVYLRSELAPLPPEIAYQPGFPSGLRWAAVGLLAAVLLVALFSWIGLGGVLAGLTQPPVGDLDGYQRSPLLDVTGTPSATGSVGLLFEFTRSPNPTFAACPPPKGWDLYIVKPTDSLLRLSMVYGLPVEALERANCMSESTIIRPGDLLHVPLRPSETPAPTITPTRRVIVLPTWTPSNSQDGSKNEAPPPTQPLPPTQPQPTQTTRPTHTSVPPSPTATNPPPRNPTHTVPAVTETVPTTEPSNGNDGGGGQEGEEGDGIIGGLLDLIGTLTPPILGFD